MAHPPGEGWENVKDVFALIIGIDQYPCATQLKGAVADANRFESFLQKQLKVKDDRMINLRNEKATRAEIARAFRSLWEHKSINHDDPIIVFFAGHGCTIRRPADWETGGRDEIEGIFPYDVQPQESSTQVIFPIPDRTIGTWLNILSYEKGNNITVIFDCCHSASGARAPGPELVRAEEFHGSLPNNIDKEYFDTMNKLVPPEFLYQHSRSHVFLAACGATEYAREEDGRGKFTKELLNNLEKDGVDQLSFVEIMKRLKPIAKQTPQCEGHFKNRILFSNILKIGWGVFPISHVKTDLKNHLNERTYRIEAGSIHGVDRNSLFDMYETAAIDTMSNKVLCRLRVQDVFPLHTMAHVERRDEVKLIKSGFARQVLNGNPLKVHFSSTFLNVVSAENVLNRADINGRVEVVEDAGGADFNVTIEDTNVVFTTAVKHVADHGFRRLPDTVPADPEHVARVLRAASHWKQHLEISTYSRWTSRVHIEFFPLELTGDQMGTTYLNRVGTSKLNKEGNVASIIVQPDNRDFYGMVIRNETGLDLHVSIVTFDIDSLHIEPYFSGAIGVDVNGDADAALPKGKRLTIGYGNGGGTPFLFNAPRDDINVTILKLYFTTMPMDLGWLKQESPFLDSISRSHMTRNDVQKLVISPEHQGATALVTIVQRAHPS